MKSYVTKNMVGMRNMHHFDYPKDIDAEMVPMLDTMNSVPGVRTVFSCCGHGGSDWYLTIAFSSEYMYDEIKRLFKTGRMVLGESDGETSTTYDLSFKYKVKDHGIGLNWTRVPEWYIAVYSDEFGQKKEAERFREYRRICKVFSRFLVRKYW